MGFIYKITNIKNNKVYIGQTIRPIKYRWRAHLNSKEQNKLHQAINTMGKQNFSCEQIEECDNTLLNERERYWIKYYNSFNNGYNMTLGGGKWRNLEDEELTQQIYQLWDDGLSITEISRELNITRTMVRSRIYGYKNYSEEEAQKRGIETAKCSKEKQVYQWTYLGKLVDVFASAREAQQITGISYKNISRAIHKEGSAGGFVWSFDNVFPKPKNFKYILCYSQEGKLLEIYPSKAQAARLLNLDASSIGKCCRGKNKTCGGFIWKQVEQI